MTLTWGTGRWGDNTWGSSNPIAPEKHTDEWPFDVVVPEDEEPIHDILTVFEYSSIELQYDIANVYEQLYLDTATGYELRALAAEVGITPTTNEQDDHLRFKTQLRKSTLRSDGTLPDLLKILQRVFAEDTAKISIAAQSGEPTVRLKIPTPLLEDIPLTQIELESELDRALPVSDPLTVITEDTLRLGESGSSGLGGKLI